MPKRLTNLIIILFAALLPANAQIFWQISGNSSAGKSYLIATDQLTDATFFDSVPNLFKLFASCNTVITEMHYDSTALTTLLIKEALLPDSMSINTLYDTKDYKALKEAIKLYLNTDIEQINKLKPIYINELIRQQLLQQWAGYNPDNSTERFFLDVAAMTNKKIIGLDNLGESIYMMFEREPIEWQTKELLRTISNPENEIHQAKTIAQLYQQGKLNEIAYQVAMPDNQTSISYSDYKKYCERNTEWVKRLTPMLRQGGQFVVLNCIYLGGDDGLIAQLRKAGFKVKPVNSYYF